MQKMAELSDGQKSRVVFAKLGRDAPHILLLVSFDGDIFMLGFFDS